MGKRILIVDDNEMNLKMAEFILSKKDYEILKTDSGEKCLDILRQESVDLVLLDIEMPVMNGIETMEKMQADKNISGVPVIFLSATSGEETLRETERLGAADYIKKPFMPQELQERVDKIWN